MGCGTSHIHDHKIQSYEPVNTYSQFLGRVLRHCDIICSNHQYEIRQSSQYLLLSWKQLMKCVDYQNLGEFIPQITNSILKLLEQLEIQIKAKSSLMLDLIQILGYLSRIIFQYFIENQKRFIRNKDQMMNMLDYIQQLIISEIDDQMILNFMEYHLFKLRTCILIIPTNSREAQQILITLFSGIIKSVSSFKLSDDLTTGIKQGLIYLYQEYDKNREKQKYQLIFYLDTIKCKLIEQFDLGIYNIDSIQLIYDTFVKNSKDWEIGCAWSELLNSILSYKLPAEAEQLVQLFNQQQIVQFQMQGKLYKRDEDYFVNLYQMEIPQKLDKLVKNQIFSNLYILFQSQLINQGQYSVKQFYSKHLQIKQSLTMQNQIIKQEISSFILNLDKFINNIDKFNVEKQVQDFSIMYQQSKFLQYFKLFKPKNMAKDSRLNQVSLQYLAHLVQNCVIETVEQYRDIIDPLVQDDLGNLNQEFNQSLMGKEPTYKLDLFKKVELLMFRQKPTQLKSEETFSYCQLLFSLLKFQYQQMIKYSLTQDQEYLINVNKFPYKILLQSFREVYEQQVQYQLNYLIFYQLTGSINQLTDQYNEYIIQLRQFDEFDFISLQDIFEQLKQLQQNIEKCKQEKQNIISLMINQIKVDQQDQIIQNLEGAKLFFNQDINTIIQDRQQIQKYSTLVDNDKHIQFLLQLNYIDQDITEFVLNIQKQIIAQIQKQLTERVTKLQNSSKIKLSLNQLQLLQNEMKTAEDKSLDLIIENIIQVNHLDSQIKALEILEQEDNTLLLKYQNKQQSVCQMIKNLKELTIFRFDDQFLTSLTTEQLDSLQQFSQKPNSDEIQLKLQQLFDHNSWRVRAFLTMQIQMFQPNMLGKNKTILEDLIVEIKFLEIDDRIKFDSQNQKLIQETLHNNWEQFEKEFKNQVKQSYDQLLELQNQISYEQDEIIKNQLTSQYNKLYKQINLQLQNVENLADAVGIVLTFLQEIRQDLKKLQDQMNRIEGKVDIIIDLLSNSYKQKLNILRNRSLQFKIQNFIQIYGQEKTKGKFGQKQLVFDQEIFNKSLFNEFLWKDEQVMLIMGNEGMGKTILSQLIEQQCWKSSKFIPLRIDLSIHNNFNKCLLQQLNENQIQELKQSNSQFLFIIDGYEHPYDNFIKYYNINSWNNFKIIFLCREAFVMKHDTDQFSNQGGPVKFIKLNQLNHQQIKDFFTSVVNSQLKHIIKQEINLSFSSYTDLLQVRQIKEVLNSKQQKEKEVLITQLNSLHKPQYYINQINNLQLMKLMNTPMMLQYLIQIINIFQQKEQTNELNQLLNIKSDQRLLKSQVRKLTNDEYLIGLAQNQPTQMDFYDILLRTQIRQNLMEKDQNIYDELIDDIIEFAQNLAYQMTINDLKSVSLIDQNLVCKQTKDWREQFFNFQGDIGQHKKSYIQLLPAYFDGLRFQFNHKTIQEYLFCLYIKSNIDILGEINISSFNISMLTQSLNQEYQLQLFKKLSNNIIMNSNIIYILSRSQFDFCGRNLQNLSIKDIDINDAVFTSTDLSNSNFENVTITGCVFDNAKLNNNQWKINIDILQILKHKDYQQTLAIKIIDKGQQVLQITTRGIIIWDIKQSKVRYEFELDGIEEYSVYDDQLICSGSDFESDYLIQMNLTNLKHSRRELQVKKICLIENNIIVYQNKDMSLKFIQNNEILDYEISFTQLIQDISSNKIYIAIIYGNYNLRLIKVQTFETYIEIKSDWQLRKVNINQQYVAYCNSVSEIIVIHLKSQQQYKLKGHQFVVELIEFLPNDRLISVSLDNTIKVWNIKNQNVQSYEKGLYQCLSVYENIMAAASQEGFIFIIDYQQLKQKPEYHQSEITAAGIGSDFIIFGHLDGQIQYFDYYNKKFIQAYNGRVIEIVILEKQLQFITYGDEQLTFWSLITFDKYSIDMRISSMCSINQKDLVVIENQLLQVIEYEWKDKFQYKMSLYHESSPTQNQSIINFNQPNDSIISKTQLGENILLFDVYYDKVMRVLTVNSNHEVVFDGQTIQNTQKDITKALIVNMDTLALFYQKLIVIHHKENSLQYKTDTQVAQIHIYNDKIFYLDGILKYIQIVEKTSFQQNTDIICEIFTISQNGEIVYQDLDGLIHLVDKNLKTKKQLFNLPQRNIKKLLYAFDYVITLQNKELKLNKQDATISITQQAEDINVQGLNLFYIENRLLKCYDLYGKELIFTLHCEVTQFKCIYNKDYSFPHLYYLLDSNNILTQINLEIPNLHTPKFIKSQGDTVISCTTNGSIWVWNKGGWRLATLIYQPIINFISAAIDTNIVAVYEQENKYHIIVWDFNSQEQIYKYINNDSIINISILDDKICYFQRKYLRDQNLIYVNYEQKTEQVYDLYGLDINKVIWKDQQIVILGHQQFSLFKMDKDITLIKNYGMRYKIQQKK